MAGDYGMKFYREKQIIAVPLVTKELALLLRTPFSWVSHAKQCIISCSRNRCMPDYQNLTDDELLHVGTEREQLTEDARVALDGELARRRLSAAEIDAYKVEYVKTDKAEKLKIANQVGTNFTARRGVGKKFLGKANRRLDPSGRFEEYESTQWFVVFWFPVFPIASFTVRRDFERWLGMVFASDPVALERHPRDWEQILLTWVKAAAFLLALRLLFLYLAFHPEWLRRLFK